MAKCVDCGVEVPEFRERCNDCVAQANLREMAEEERARKKASRARGEDTSRGYVNTGLIVVNFAVFVAMVVMGVSPMEPTAQEVLRWGANYGPLTLSGDWWRLISAMFLHFGILHIGMNMYALWQLGTLAEALVGPTLYVFVYMLTGVAGFLLSVIWHPGTVSAGASAPISGILGLLIAVLYFHYVPIIESMRKALLNSLIQSAVIVFLIGLWGPIDNAAHLGGFAFGLFLGWVLCLLKRQSLELRLIAMLLSSVLLVGGYLAVERGHAAELSLVRARSAAQTGNFAAAERYAKQSIASRGETIESLSVLAVAQFEQKKYDDATRTLEKLLQRDPNDGWATGTLGAVYLRQGKLGEAKSLLEKAIALEEKLAFAHADLGQTDLLLRDLPNAEREYRRAVELDASDATAYYGLGQVLKAKGDIAGAREAFTKALQIDKNFAEAQRALDDLRAGR